MAVTSDDAVAERLRFLQNAMGGVPGPFDCFLVLRGLRTLPLRMARHSANGAGGRALPRDARRTSPAVSYPGLDLGDHAHPRAAVAAAPDAARRRARVRRDGLVRARRRVACTAARAAERAVAVCESTRLFALAESLGGVESLIEIPAAMTHMSVAASPLAVDPALVRLSVGIEAADDLIADLAQALDGA